MSDPFDDPFGTFTGFFAPAAMEDPEAAAPAAPAGAPNLLRELVKPEDFEADAPRALLDAALLIRRAGLEHLVQGELELPEIWALALAGKRLEEERADLLAEKLARKLERALGSSGGVLEKAFAAVRAREGRS